MSELLNFILDHEEAFKSRARLSSLYSDFQQSATTNPDGYQANIAAWKKAFTDAARAGVLPSQGAINDLLSIRTGEELSRALASKEWGRPLALPAVIHEAVAKKDFIPLKEFLSATTSIYHKSWVISPWQVVAWGLRQLGVLGDGVSHDKMAVGQFVIVANIEAAANTILKQIEPKSTVDLIYSHAAFLAEFAHCLSDTHPLTPSDLRVLLTYLSRDKRALTYNPTTIKFASPSSTTPPEPITQQDITIANLRTLISSLNSQIPALESRISSLNTTARSAVASKSRTAALSALRSKKLAETTLARRVDTLTQLEDTFGKIQAAADNVEVVRVMQASAGVLRGLNERVGGAVMPASPGVWGGWNARGGGAEGVEGVVDALREEMGRVDEVSGVLNEVGAEGAVDEGEVDEEFEALEKAEWERVGKVERERREEREKEEAERVRVRMEELDGLERERREKEKEKQDSAMPDAPTEDLLAKSIEGMQSMSLSSKPAPSSAEANSDETTVREKDKQKEAAAAT